MPLQAVRKKEKTRPAARVVVERMGFLCIINFIGRSVYFTWLEIYSSLLPW
jgi:hypothetical protein